MRDDNCDAADLPDPMLNERSVERLAAMLEARIAAAVPGGEGKSGRLRAAVRHAALAPGKRARGLIALLVAESWGRPAELALDAAAAIELVHAASLVLDDLPVMDDTPERRGRPSCHVAYGEAAAVLAAVALLGQAFGMVAADLRMAGAARLDLVDVLSRSIGLDGMTGGQDLDLAPPPDMPTVADIEAVHAAKTGALFEAAALAGAIAAGIDGPRRALMAEFGLRLGLGFQALDDLADEEPAPSRGGAGTEGRPSVSDWPGISVLIGQEGARDRADRHVAAALECLEASGANAARLAQYVEGLVELMRGKAEATRTRRRAAAR